MSRDGEFDVAASLLEELTALSRIEARGTLRIALKTAGYDAGGITREAIQVVIERVLPEELKARGIEAAETICLELLGRLPEPIARDDMNSPEDVFARIGRG